MTDIPHFDYPFRLNRNRAQVVEQDSPEDVMNCVQAILKTPIGFRIELPGFGVTEQSLREGGADTSLIRSALDTWEPRARYSLDAADIVDLVQQVNVNVESRSDA